MVTFNELTLSIRKMKYPNEAGRACALGAPMNQPITIDGTMRLPRNEDGSETQIMVSNQFFKNRTNVCAQSIPADRKSSGHRVVHGVLLRVARAGGIGVRGWVVRPQMNGSPSQNNCCPSVVVRDINTSPAAR